MKTKSTKSTFWVILLTGIALVISLTHLLPFILNTFTEPTLKTLVSSDNTNNLHLHTDSNRFIYFSIMSLICIWFTLFVWAKYTPFLKRHFHIFLLLSAFFQLVCWLALRNHDATLTDKDISAYYENILSGRATVLLSDLDIEKTDIHNSAGLQIALDNGRKILLPNSNFHKKDLEKFLSLIKIRKFSQDSFNIQSSNNKDINDNKMNPLLKWLLGVFPFPILLTIFFLIKKRIFFLDKDYVRFLVIAVCATLSFGMQLAIAIYILYADMQGGFAFWPMWIISILLSCYFTLLFFTLFVGKKKFLKDYSAQSDILKEFRAMPKADYTLFDAMTRHQPDLIRRAVADGARINELWPDGQTPLYKAVNNGLLEIVKALLTCGTDPNIPTSRGHFPLHEALGQDKTSSDDRVTMVKLLLDHGADPNVLDWGRPALHYALYDTKLIKTLLSSGADINGISVYHDMSGPRKLQNFEFQENAIRYAVKLGLPENIIDLLLQSGADPLTQNSEGYTAWDWAINDSFKRQLVLEKQCELISLGNNTNESKESLNSIVSLHHKTIELLKPFVITANFDCAISYATGSGWGEFFRGRIAKTGKRIWSSTLLKRNLPYYEEVMEAHLSNLSSAVVFLSPEHFDNASEKYERRREMQVLLDKFESTPDKLLIVLTDETGHQIINQYPKLKRHKAVQLDEFNINELWRLICKVCDLPQEWHRNLFLDLQQTDNDQYDCFLSYRTASSYTVRFIAEQLVARGVKPWLAEWEIVISGRYHFQDMINYGLAASKTVLCCTNISYALSEYCRIEAMQVLKAPGKEPSNILDLRIPDEPNKISNLLQDYGSNSVVINKTSINTEWTKCCDFLKITSDDLPIRSIGGSSYRFAIDLHPFLLNIDKEWSVKEVNMATGYNDVTVASFERTIDKICLECALVVGPWHIDIEPSTGENYDRLMFESILRAFRMYNASGKVFYPRGVHVVHIPAIKNTQSEPVAHPAITYLDTNFNDYERGVKVPIDKCTWHRKYFIRVNPPYMTKDLEFCFGFDMKGVAHNDFATFCRYAYMMDDLVSGLSFPDA